MKTTQLLLPLLVCLLLLVHKSTQQTTAPCFNQLSMNSSYVAETSTAYSTPYACGLLADNAAANGGTLVLSVNSAGCPDSCSGLDYSCAEVVSTAKTSYGYYECTMKPSGKPGTVTSCSLVSTTRIPYEEIFVKFIGNDTSRVYVGYVTDGMVYSAGPVSIKVNAEEEFHRYGFEWQSNYIKWFVDNVEVSSELGSRPLPKSPSRFTVNFLVEIAGIVTDNSAIYTDANIDRAFVAPVLGEIVVSSFQNLTYIPSLYISCDPTSGIIPGNVNYTAYDTEACTVAPVAVVYEDALATGWSDTGSTTHSLVSKGQIRSGINSISWDVIPAAILMFTYSGTISQSDYYSFEFWVYGGGKAGQQIEATLQLPGGLMSTAVNLNLVLTSGIQAYTWSRVILPFSTFGIDSTTVITGLTLTAVGTGFGGTIYLDSLILGQQYAFCINRTMIIYDDQLSSDFTDQSYGSLPNLASTSPVFAGSKAIAWTMYGNNGIKFHAKTAVDTNVWQGVQLYVNYQKLTGWDFTIAATVNGQAQGIVRLLDYYGGSFPSGDWVKVVIPFTNFGFPAGTMVDGVQLACTTTEFEGTLSIDQMAFVSTIPEVQQKSNPNGAAQVCMTFSLTVLSLVYLIL